MKKGIALSLLGLLVSAVAAFNMACAEKSSNRADIARKRVTPVLNSFLEPCGARVGSPVFLRAVKEDSVLELWVKPDKSECYMLAKRYPIAAWSGKLGPKEKEGGTGKYRKVFMKWSRPGSIPGAITICLSTSGIRMPMTVP